jgi:hypothetical protein
VKSIPQADRGLEKEHLYPVVIAGQRQDVELVIVAVASLKGAEAVQYLQKDEEYESPLSLPAVIVSRDNRHPASSSPEKPDGESSYGSKKKHRYRQQLVVQAAHRHRLLQLALRFSVCKIMIFFGSNKKIKHKCFKKCIFC